MKVNYTNSCITSYRYFIGIQKRLKQITCMFAKDQQFLLSKNLFWCW